MTELAKIIEAILFVSGEPVQLGAVAGAVDVRLVGDSAAAADLPGHYVYNGGGF